MNHEFFITKTVDIGSEGEINEISYEELVRLNQFLTEFLKKEEGNHEQS